MTALAGIWSFGERLDPTRSCTRILESQARFGPHDSAVATEGPTAFGRALFRTLAEDRADKQPARDGEAGTMIVADIRLDNRDEVFSRLGRREDSGLSDSQLLFHAWKAWREDSLDLLLGDFAFAVWEPADETLWLVRDPTGQRPLHYHQGDGFVAFASMPCGLHALEEIPKALDDSALARFIADIPRSGPQTSYREICRVLPGHVAKVTRRGLETRDYWKLPDREIRYNRNEDYVEGLREQIDRATKARLRRSQGAIAAHLSAGLDSNAVATTAARLLAPEGQRLLALTSAPGRDFSGAVPSGRIADESEWAASTAALHPNMEHVVIRPAGPSPIDILKGDALAFEEPIGLPCNHTWWSAINSEASRRGASVILTGEAGNLTISAGGLAMLADLVRSGNWEEWYRQARASISSGIRARGVLATSFGPFVPRAIWSLAARTASRHSPSERGQALLNPDWASRLGSEARKQGRGGRPEGSNRDFRWSLLRSQDPGNFKKVTLSRWGLDERDPTADRRLAEYCFALPPEQYFADGMKRRLARLALRDRVPESVLNAPRGYQFADWHESISREALQSEVAALGASRKVAALVDMRRLDELADRWPPGDWGSERTIGTWRVAMLRALSAGRFAQAFMSSKS